MRRLLRAALLSGVILCAPLATHAGTPAGAKPVGAATTVLTTVDAITVYGATLFLKGVVEGEATATEWSIGFSSNSSAPTAEPCQRLAMLVLTKPGAYKLELSNQLNPGSGICRLVVVQP